MEASSTCLIHLCDEENDDLKVMTHTNWAKIKSCAEVWLSLEGRDKYVATSESSQKTPKQFKKFLSNGQNKESLIHFI